MATGGAVSPVSEPLGLMEASMTTAVVVHPAGHRVKVELLGKAEGQTTETIMEPNTPPLTFHVWDGQDIRISEVPAGEVVVPPAAHSSPEEDS